MVTMQWAKKQTGFTIVELLIVIVVIGILAAITIVAFNGVQQKARTVTTVTAVNDYRKALINYAVENGSYPTLANGSNACLGEKVTQCYAGNVDTAFESTMKTRMGSLPEPDDTCYTMYSGCRSGAAFSLMTTATLDGEIHPWGITYVLSSSVDCGGDGLVGGTWGTFTSTPNSKGYIERSQQGTLCRVNLPDPSNL